MDGKQAVAKEDETHQVHFKGHRIEQTGLNPGHPAIKEMEQRVNAMMDLCQRPPEERKLLETLKEENKLLKAKLKGFEALAYLYQQSKNECANLRKLCADLSDEKEEYRRKFSAPDADPTETPVCPVDVEKNTFEAVDPVGSLHEETKLNSGSKKTVGVQTLNLNECSAMVVLQNEAFHLAENHLCGKPEGVVDLRSGEFKQALGMGDRTSDDESQSSFSYLDMQSSLAASDDGDRNENREKTHNLAASSEVPGDNKELFGSRELMTFHRHLMKSEVSKESKSFLRELLSFGIKFIGLDEQMQTEENLERRTLLSESQRQRSMVSSATQTLDQMEIPECNRGQSDNLELTSKVDRLARSSSCERRKSSVVTEDLVTEVQILRQQVMTFKDDFERERRDREKVRAEYDLLKQHFDRISVDFCDIKDKLRSTEIKLDESEMEKTALRHKITKTADELRRLKKSSSPSRTEVNPQRVSPLDVPQSWPCVHCTFLNPHPRRTCEMCGHAAGHRYRSPLQVP